MTAVRLHPRAAAAILLASLGGALAFLWPLIAGPGWAHAIQGKEVVFFGLLVPMLMGVVLLEIGEGGLDAKAVAMLGVLGAVGAALRPLSAGTAGIEFVFVLIILGGRVFGPGFGFVLGCVTLFGSALITGGVGPWLPYQMFGAAWVGMFAGLLPAKVRGLPEVVMLAAYGAISGLLYGLVLNLQGWPYGLGGETQFDFVPGAPVLTNLHTFLLYSVTTSLGWDLGRAITNVVLIAIAGPAVLATLRRAARKANFN